MRKGLVTSNDQKPTGQGEPQKLNIITSAIIPETKPQPEPKGTDLSRMITTHDIGDEVEVEMGRPIKMETGSDDEIESLPAPPEILHQCVEAFAKKVDADFKADIVAGHKKAGRPKKAE